MIKADWFGELDGSGLFPHVLAPRRETESALLEGGAHVRWLLGLLVSKEFSRSCLGILKEIELWL